MLEGIRDKVRGYIPFTNWWMVWHKLDKRAKSILDLGCGKGEVMLFINRHKQFQTVGIDSFKPYVELCKKGSTHDMALIGDIRQIPYRDKTFDIVMLLGVLEHLEREEGEALLRRMEAIARRQVILTTPIGTHVFGSFEGNAMMAHKTIWSIKDLKGFGLSIFGMGLPHWGGDTGLSRFLAPTLRGLVELPLRWITGLFVYFYPRFGGQVLCVKSITRELVEA